MRAAIGSPQPRRGLRWASAAVAAAALSGAAILALSSTAHAAAPTPNYHPGADTATFTVTGVLDSNCPVSTGGTEIWIKPGDTINFNSSLAGIDVNGVALGAGSVSGLNVTAVIDPTNRPQAAQTVNVTGGNTTAFPATNQTALAPGDHTITWQATSLSVLSILGVPSTVPVPAGVSTSWTGVVHVTNDAPTCKLAIGTPSVGVTLGPVKVTVPPTNIGIPAPIAVPTNLIPGAGASKPPASGSNPGPGGRSTGYTPPGLTVPQQVMPLAGSGSGGFFGAALPDNGSAPIAGAPSGTGPTSATNANVPIGSGPAAPSDATKRSIELAANKAPAARAPVVLAVIAIIALSLVTATYARLYLLRRHLT